MPSPRTWRRLPLRARLIAGFVAVMVVVLTAAGGFVYWRVQVALDRTLDGDLQSRSDLLRQSWTAHPDDPVAVLAALPPETLGQLVDRRGTIIASTPSAASDVLLPHRSLAAAASGSTRIDGGNVLTGGKKRLRSAAFALPAAPGSPELLGVTAVHLGQRDEALRELLAQLALANLAALALAAGVGYRLTRAALLPVERYRARAEQITTGASGLRLDVPVGTDDEISRLGHTLNHMLTALEASAEQQRRFLADASHELRTPLSVLTSEVELALRRPRSASDYELVLQQVAEDTARLVALADQLLDLEHDPTAGAASDAVVAAERATGRGRALTDREVSLTGPSTATVGASAFVLDRVLGNLVDNAVRHGAGRISVEIDASALDLVRILVHDEGSAVPEDFVPHAVERFRRVDEARTDPGSGLGLSLVHALVSGVGGELRMCTGGHHHRFSPLLHEVPCAHSQEGTSMTVLLPTS